MKTAHHDSLFLKKLHTNGHGHSSVDFEAMKGQGFSARTLALIAMARAGVARRLHSSLQDEMVRDLYGYDGWAPPGHRGRVGRRADFLLIFLCRSKS
jgi:hypothetical protein